MSNNKKEMEAQEVLESFVSDYKIFIDTCSLLELSSNLFWKNIIPLLHINLKKIIIPIRCIEELQKHARNASDISLANRAKECLKQLEQLSKAGYIDFRGEKSDNFADNVFNVVFTKFRLSYNLLLITQDHDLAYDILNLNDSKSVNSRYKIQVKRINKYGYLSSFSSKDTSSRVDKGRKIGSNRSTLPNTPVSIGENELFEKSTVLTSIPNRVIPVSKIPTEHELAWVYTDRWNSIELVEKLGSGGEAFIYSTSTPFVAKIYKKDNITEQRYQKIKLMLSKEISFPGICYPVAMLYNDEHRFIGFLMPPAKGKELQRGIFLVKQIFQKNFPGWKKRDTVELCITILKKIQYLHNRNIIMGDINPSNILVVSPTEVYFVDTDSYQVEGFPCPVGTVNYTAPEIQRKDFSTFLRTIGNENFAVATLLFMIMLPGKPPYSQQGGEDPVNNIIRMDFSYPFGDSSNKKTPDGPWRYIWSHLTYDIKEAFYTTFRKNEKHSTEMTRLSVNEWLSLFEYYLELLDSGKFGQQDKMSEELYPNRYKKNSKFTYVTCKLCGSEVQENHCQNGICQNCLNKGETYNCSSCGKEIVYTNYQKYIKHAKKYDICHDCYENGKKVYIRQMCTDCHSYFEITNSEYQFYQSKGMELPKRCKACRQNRKNSTYNSAYTRSYSNSSTYSQNNSSSEKNSSKGNGSFCFLTTVVCNYLGKLDDCIELETLRDYRDTWLKNQPNGMKQIEEYYNTAPLLVSLLEKSEHYSEYCEIMWSKYIVHCLNLIKQKKYEECRKVYEKMFVFLKKELM